MASFRIKRAFYKVTKDAEGKDVRTKTKDTETIEMPLPEFCETVAGFKKVFAKLPDVDKLADDHFCAGETVKVQAFLRLQVEPEKWTLENLQAALKTYTPQKQTRGKSQEAKMAEKYEISEEKLMELLAKHAGK